MKNSLLFWKRISYYICKIEMEFSFLKRNWKGRRGKGLHLHSWIARAFLFLPASYFSLVITSFLSDIRYWDLPWRLNLFLVLQSRGTSATYFTTQWNKPQTQRWSYNKYIIETWEHQTFLRRIILHTSHSNFYSFRDKFKNSRIIINSMINFPWPIFTMFYPSLFTQNPFKISSLPR